MRSAIRNVPLTQVSHLEGIGSPNTESSHYNILVVDDEEQIRKLIASLLATKGHHVTTARNGLEALDKIGKYDAVISDVVMPEMDGITLTEELSKQYQSLPVMVMTGLTEDYLAETAIASGARTFIDVIWKQLCIDVLLLKRAPLTWVHHVNGFVSYWRSGCVFGLLSMASF